MCFFLLNKLNLILKLQNTGKMEHYDEVVEVKRKPKVENPARTDDSERITTKRPASAMKSIKTAERVTSESESSDTGTEDNGKVFSDGFDYRIWESLDLPKNIKDLYQYIAR